MIYILSDLANKESPLTLKQLQLAWFVAVKNEGGSYHILKDRMTGKTGLDVSPGLLLDYIHEFLKIP